MDLRYLGLMKSAFLMLVLIVCISLLVIEKRASDERFGKAATRTKSASIEDVNYASVSNVTEKAVTKVFLNASSRIIRYPMPVALTEQQRIAVDEALQKAQENKRYILNWYAQSKKRVQFRGVCGRCEVTSNRSMINNPDTKAIVFLYREIHGTTMPSPLMKRRSDQLHVWQTGEAPPSVLFLHRRYMGYEEKYRFNMTQTFRRDSGIYHPYGSTYAVLMKKIKDGFNKNISKVLDGKTRVALAVMSNCHSIPAANIRLQFVRDLKSDGLNVHTLGQCFKYSTYAKKDKSNFGKLLRTYKFFLAFENSYHCRDYITEKFFINGLEAGAIPVVWGATKENYDAIAPPGSYIYADDFNTTKDLIAYMNYLSQNDSAFLEYFKWYQMEKEKLPDYGRQIRYCQLCRIIHGINVDDLFHPDYDPSNPERPLVSDEISQRTVKSLKNWYYKTEYSDCLKSPSRFYRDNKSLPAKTLDGRM